MRPANRQEVPVMLPGICARCRCNEQAREYFVDTGFDLEFEGVCYICNKCLEDIAKASGEFFLKTEVDDLLAVQLNEVKNAASIVSHKEEFNAWVLETTGLNFDHLEKKFYESRRIPTELVASDDGFHGEAAGTDGSDSPIEILGADSPDPLPIGFGLSL